MRTACESDIRATVTSLSGTTRDSERVTPLRWPAGGSARKSACIRKVPRATPRAFRQPPGLVGGRAPCERYPLARDKPHLVDAHGRKVVEACVWRDCEAGVLRER